MNRDESYDDSYDESYDKSYDIIYMNTEEEINLLSYLLAQLKNIKKKFMKSKDKDFRLSGEEKMIADFIGEPSKNTYYKINREMEIIEKKLDENRNNILTYC